MPAGHSLGVGRSFRGPTSAFTLVELLIGMSLALMVMAAVLSSYLFIGRNLARLANQQTLETQGRRALAYFAQDVRMASGIDTTGVSPKVLPSATGVTLILPTSSSPTTVTYTYNSAAGTLTRTPAGGTAQILVSNLLTFTFNYYDASNNPYTSYIDYLSGIKQLSITFTSQAGSSSSGTRTPVYQVASNRLLIRNRGFLQ